MRLQLLSLTSLVMILRLCVAFKPARLPFRRTRATACRPLASSAALTATDQDYLQDAIACATHGLGRTFPNPAVGCVLVRQEDGAVLGKGFHPRAGYPHAEVFALLEAAGLVPDGVAAAQEIMRKPEGQEDQGVVEELLARYAATDGAQELFGNLFASTPVTAFVTLEPCCHYGLTPPCALSLAASQVSRVVVGFRDPNPRVDGGGVKLLQDAGVPVEVLDADGSNPQAAACAALVRDFGKRITPSVAHDSDYAYVTGAMRRALRALCQNKKRSCTMVEIPWKGARVATDEDMEASLAAVVLPGKWMEQVDAALWKEELVVLRLNAATAKKKGAKLLGERIAGQLRAHVAQTVGHTCLLYRPGMPAVLDLEALVQTPSPSE